MMRSMFCQAMAVLVVEEPSVILIVSRFLLAKLWFVLVSPLYAGGGASGQLHHHMVQTCGSGVTSTVLVLVVVCANLY